MLDGLIVSGVQILCLLKAGNKMSGFVKGRKFHVHLCKYLFLRKIFIVLFAYASVSPSHIWGLLSVIKLWGTSSYKSYVKCGIYLQKPLLIKLIDICEIYFLYFLHLHLNVFFFAIEAYLSSKLLSNFGRFSE